MAHTTAASNFLVPNGTFIPELIAFVIVLWVLWKYVFPPLQKAMGDRQEMIRKQLEESEAAKKRLEQAQVEYQQALAGARHEAAQMKAEAEEQRKAIVERAAGEAERRAQEIVTRAQEQIEAERRQAVRQLRAEIGTLALELAGRIVGESMDDDDRQRRVVERFIADLEQSDEDRSEAGQVH
jgi:F-type H+-transporting ATPase subunit b